MAINKITLSIKGTKIIPLLDNKPYKKLSSLEDYSLFLKHILNLSNIKYQSITVSTYHYSCSDGCCYDEGYKVYVNEEMVYEGNDEFDSLLIGVRNFYDLVFELVSS